MRSSIRRLIPAAGALLVAGALTACSGSTGSTGSMPGMDHGSSGMSSMPTAGATTSTATASASTAGDVTFAQMMIPHHEQAVEMADIALGKPAASAQVRALATQIKAGQDPEIQKMRGWLQAWGAPLPTDGMSHEGMAGMSGQGMMTQADMDALKAADGAAFDTQWVTMMTEHHDGAITMAKQVLSTTQNPEVKALAEAVVKAQTDEIATMKSLT